MKFTIPFLFVVAVSLSACQSKPVSDEAIIDSVAAETKKEQDNKESEMLNPARCQQAKLDLVEIESSQDIPMINQAKAAVMRYCDNIE
jgi:hypothetical protein